MSLQLELFLLKHLKIVGFLIKENGRKPQKLQEQVKNMKENIC
jgi:hypothetical protein